MDAADQPRDGGSWDTAYSDEAFINVVERLGWASTSAVAEAVGCHRMTASRRLRRLAQEGKVVKVNDYGHLRWVPANADEEPTPAAARAP